MKSLSSLSYGAFLYAMTFTMGLCTAQDPVCSGDPSECGQWAGPIDLGPYINVPVPAGGNLDQGEIGHAALILGGPHSGRILLWCWPDTGPNYQPLTYLWTPTSDPAAPVELDVIEAPTLSPWSLSNDIFCAGHAFTSTGDLVVAGGEDICTKLNPTVCPPPPLSTPPYGAETAYIFRIASGSWEAVPADNDMERERWYPTAVELPDGNVIVLGHAGWNELSDPVAEQSREIYDVASGAFQPLRKNHRYANMNCNNTPYVAIHDYPRFHVTASNELMWMDGADQAGNHTAFFLGLPPKVPECSTFEEEYRWRPGVPSSVNGFQHRGGNSVHFLIYTSATTVNEVIYAIGGIDGPDNTTNCSGTIYDRVAKLTNPSASAVWDETATDLYWERYNHNSVILFDGSILVVGGTGYNQFGACKPKYTPELFYPIEVFGVATWWPAAIHTQPREYHSTAILLLNGQVASIGGQEYVTADPEDKNKHNVEVYSPPLTFPGRIGHLSKRGMREDVRHGKTTETEVHARAAG